MSSSIPPISSSSPGPGTTTTTTTTTSGGGGNKFDFPREYNFPPFFTRQTNLATLHSQRETWSGFILDYCRHHRIFRLSLSSSITGTGTGTGTNTAENAAPATTTSASAASLLSSSSGDAAAAAAASVGNNTQELFHNRRIDRRLSLADARDVLEHMRKAGRAEPVSSSSSNTSSTAENSSSGGGGGGGGGDASSGSSDVWWIYWRTPEEWAAMIEAYVDETAQRGTVLTLYELVEGEGTRGRDFYGLPPDLLQKALQTLVRRGKAQIFGQEESQGIKFF